MSYFIWRHSGERYCEICGFPVFRRDIVDDIRLSPTQFCFNGNLLRFENYIHLRLQRENKNKKQNNKMVKYKFIVVPSCFTNWRFTTLLRNMMSINDAVI